MAASDSFPSTGEAGEGSRTLVFSLEGYGSTVELHPQSIDPANPNRRKKRSVICAHDLTGQGAPS